MVVGSCSVGTQKMLCSKSRSFTTQCSTCLIRRKPKALPHSARPIYSQSNDCAPPKQSRDVIRRLRRLHRFFMSVIRGFCCLTELLRRSSFCFGTPCKSPYSAQLRDRSSALRLAEPDQFLT